MSRRLHLTGSHRDARGGNGRGAPTSTVVAATRLGELDEVAVRVAHVERPQRADRARPGDRPLLDWDAGRVELALDVRERAVDEQAEVRGAGRRAPRVWRVLGARDVEVELLEPE